MNTRRALVPFASLLGLSLPLLASSVVLSHAGCTTDNGDNSYGPDYGPLPKRDGAAEPGEPGEGGEPGDPDGGPGEGDGGEEAAAPCASGTIAVLAGSDGALTGAVKDRNGPWVTAPVAGGAAKSNPALVAFGAGFLGVTHGTGDALQSTTYAGSWSAAASLGNPGVKGPPSLTVAGTQAHVVYSAGLGPDRFFFHGIHDGTSWNAATATVGTPGSFGTVSAGLAAVGNEVVFAENGTDNGLYVRSFTSSWSDGQAVFGAGTIGGTVVATPEVVAVEGPFDLLLVYVDNDPFKGMAWATRDTNAPKVWKNGGNIANALTVEKFALAAIGPSTVVVTFRGEDGKGYYTRGTIEANGDVLWSTVQPIGGGAAFAVDATPAVAKGVCGDDAVVAYASGDAVRVTRLRGTSWSTPETVGNATGRRVAIATR